MLTRIILCVESQLRFLVEIYIVINIFILRISICSRKLMYCGILSYICRALFRTLDQAYIQNGLIFNTTEYME